MKKNKTNLYFIVGATIIVISLFVYGFKQRLTLNNLPFVNQKTDLQIQIVDKTGQNLDFELNQQFPSSEQYLQHIKESPIATNQIVINVSHDTAIIGAKFWDKEKVVKGGYSYRNEGITTTLEIYLPADLPDTEISYRFNQSALRALLYAAESKKIEVSNGTYKPTEEELNTLTNQIIEESYEKSDYAFKRK